MVKKRIPVSGVPYNVEYDVPVMERISWDEYFLRMAELAALRSTCRRRMVGCILVDKHSDVLATGYNGGPRGFTHCLDDPCEGALAMSGTDLHKCMAIHAEQNALLQCANVQEIEAAYCTTSPCAHNCIQLLLNTSCKRIVFREEYPNSESKIWWENAGREWLHLGAPNWKSR